MEVSQTESLPPPPGIISSIKAGFDSIAAHITAILLPLALNLFLWLGPRLRMNELFDSIKDDMVAIWRSGGVPAEDIQRVLVWYGDTIPVVNLFWLLRTIPVGVSSLLFPQSTTQTPLGVPADLQVSGLSLMGWVFLLTLVGWVAGGLYYRSVAQVAMAGRQEQKIGVLSSVAQTILLSILWTVVLFAIGLPFLLLMGLLLQISPVIANVLVVVFSLASMWVIVPLFFWPHGVFITQQNVFLSIMSSMRMARFTLPTSSLFVLTVFLMTFGLNLLWSIPPQDSWITFLAIFGHSFVTTALLAGSFIYYRDMNIWLQAAMEKFRTRSINKQA